MTSKVYDRLLVTLIAGLFVLAIVMCYGIAVMVGSGAPMWTDGL
jgi:integral membrane sensor domain MASE1